MTKPDLFAGLAHRHHIAEFDLPISDNHPINQKLDQRSFLLKCGLLQSLLYTLAETFKRFGQSRKLLLPICLRLQLSCLLLDLLLTPLKIAAAPAIFVKQHHAGEIGLRQALELLRQARLATPQPLPARVPFLWQPVSAMRPLQGLRNLLGMDQKVAQISPNQGIQPLGRRQPRWALLLAM